MSKSPWWPNFDFGVEVSNFELVHLFFQCFWAFSPDCNEQLFNSPIAPDHPLLQDVSSKLIQVNIAVPIWVHPAIVRMFNFGFIILNVLHLLNIRSSSTRCSLLNFFRTSFSSSPLDVPFLDKSSPFRNSSPSFIQRFREGKNSVQSRLPG